MAPPDAPRRASLHEWLDRLPLLDELAASGEPCIAACSGGADSLALAGLAAASRVRLVLVHVDHGLRAGSEGEFAVVAAAARRLGAGARAARVAVAAGPNLEARARDARYEALERERVAAGAAAVLVGHTADDQAETVLLNLLRGAATAGLAAMAPRQGRIVRPLLGLRRADTLEVCARLGFAPLVDPMNADVRFRRVWLRREVLPALEAGAGRDLRGLLARQADVLRDESDLLDALAARALTDAGEPPEVAALAALEPALARRALRHWLGHPRPSLATIDELLAVVGGDRRALELPGGRRVVRRRGRLVLEATTSAPSHRAAPTEFRVPGPVAAGGIALESWVEAAPPVAWPDGIGACVVDADAVGDRAFLRGPGPGERFAPLGLAGTKLVRAVADRPHVVASDVTGGVVWVVGYRIDDRVRVTSRTRRFLWMVASSA